MKNKMLLKAAGLFVAVCVSSVMEGTMLPEKESRSIQIEQVPKTQTQTPRLPAAASIEAALDAENGVVEVWLSRAGDAVAVDLENLDTGTFYRYTVSGEGSAVLYIGAEAGSWTITFTLSNGTQYYGVFFLF